MHDLELSPRPAHSATNTCTTPGGRSGDPGEEPRTSDAWRRVALALFCTGLLSLHGCGGGGSSAGPAPTGTNLSGEVVDGPVGGATGSVFALSASGTQLPSTTQLPEPL